MAVMGFNAGAEMSQLRTQQTLAMQAAAPAAGTAAPAAGVDQTAAMATAAAAPSGATADAAAGAVAVGEPPATGKIVMQSVLKGALSGASVALGIKQFGPLLAKFGPIGKLVGALPVAAKVGPPAVAKIAGTGLLGFLSKIPVVGKLLPMAARSGLAGFAIAALMGAAVGAIGGLIKGRKEAKAKAAEYADAMARQQAQQAAQPPAGDPVNTPGPADAPAPAPAGKRAKSWIISRQGSTQKTGGSFGTYTTHKGDTVAMLAKRFHTTAAEIKRLNPGLDAKLEAGTELRLKRRVVPNAKAWVA